MFFLLVLINRANAQQPEVFLPGKVSSGLNERDMAISPDGKKMYYTIQSPRAGVSVIVQRTWDGKNWNLTGDWLQGDEQIIRPMVKAAAAKYAAEKKITPRTPADCQS